MSNSILTFTPGWVRDEMRFGPPPWAGFWKTHGRLADGDWSPATDLYDAGDRLIAEIELPGIARDSIEITVQDHVLTIKAASRKRIVEGEDLICCERPHGTFARSLELEPDVDANQVEATYTDGVLEIVLPKAESAKPHKINVTAK